MHDPRAAVYGIRLGGNVEPAPAARVGVLTEELRDASAKDLRRRGRGNRRSGRAYFDFVIEKFDELQQRSGVRGTPLIRLARGHFHRHDFSFKPTFTEMAPVAAGSDWTGPIANTVEACKERIVASCRGTERTYQSRSPRDRLHR